MFLYYQRMEIDLIPTDQRSDKQQIFLKDNDSFESMVKSHHKMIAFIDIQKQHMESNMF